MIQIKTKDTEFISLKSINREGEMFTNRLESLFCYLLRLVLHSYLVIWFSVGSSVQITLNKKVVNHWSLC